MKENKNFEQLFRQEFETFEAQPSNKVWRGIRSNLFLKKFFHFSPRSVNAWYVGGALIIAGIAAFIFTPSVKHEPPVTSTVIVNDITKLADTTYNKDILGEFKAGGQKSEIRSSESLNRSRESEDQSLKTKARSSELVLQKTTVKPETQNTEIINTALDEKPIDRFTDSFNSYGGQAVFAYFKSSANEGCAPLSASFNNFSQNAVRYSWSFGDGGSSDLKNPSYIFDEPGTWFVSLTAFSSANEISIFTDSIKVNPLPEARFSMDIQGLPGDGQPVYFNNYSRGAETYLWNFGDGATSTLKDPDHYFSKKAQTKIKLLAFSATGCIDSTILKDAFKEGEPAFIFPTAFSPNTTGPQSGQYTRKSPDNDIFYPFVEEEPEEYQLKIFNRNGILIFESADIHIGWDGYYHEELMPQGVYVWKARAKFADGRSVVKMGDVTLLFGE
jgi:gliding motility-associated-like protein